MIKDAKPYSVSQIFTRDLKWFYQIPIYQRAYTWGVKEWTTLFNDIDENDSGYFLGSIICVNNSSSTISQKVTFQVIDGQQRITSLSILLLALYNKIMSTGGSFTESQQDSLKDIKKEIVSITNDDDEIYSARLSLQIQDSNNNDYIALLSENKLLEEASKPKNAGNRRIYRAYKTFLGLIDNYIEGEEKPIKALFSLAKKVNGAVMVFIEVDTNKDAYMLFESLNNRGIPLSAIDLIKNYLISIADDRHNRSTAEKVYRQWERTVSYLGEDYSIQERFLRQYYNAFREELNKTYRSDDTVAFPLGYLATKSTMLDIYEKMIKDDYESFLNELEEKAKIYAILINRPPQDSEITELKDSLMDLERIQGAPAYILLMYLVANKDTYNLAYGQINVVVKYLVKFFVRRNLTDYPNTRNLTKIFMDTISDIRDNANGDIVKIICDKLKSVSSDDKDFEEKLRGDVYINNVDSTRFILCYYENKYKTNEIHSDLWARDKNNKYIWTIEHIFPEGENIPQSWVKMIADGDNDKAQLLREQYVHKFGNLTITGYNSNLSALSFEEKKNRRKDDKYIGYKNGLKLNKSIVNKNVWTVQEIKDRTDALVTTFLNEFSLNT